jgi:sigma-B regulation protein RsbU (phosphoserine phosphatase)
VREDGVQEHNDSRGIALGVVPEVVIAATPQDLRHGDILVLYTDGITEAENRDLEMFGIERLERIILASSQLPADKLIQEILTAVRAFTGDHAQ